MKKNTAYFVIGSVAFLFLVGIFVYISTSTYSVYDGSVSIEDMNLPVNGTKEINVNFNGGTMTEEEISSCHLNWEVNSNAVSLDSSTTSLSNPNNSVTALRKSDNVTVTVGLYCTGRGISISTDTATISIFDIEDINFTNVNDTTSFSVNISNVSEKMLLPSKYSSNRVEWNSSKESVLTISSNGVINPLSAGISTVSASVYDEEDNIIAIATQAVTIVVNGGNSNRTDLAGDSEEDDYSLKSISVNGKANILEGTTTDYLVQVSDGTSFKINAVANNGGTVKIINDEDGKVYNNNDSIPWKTGSPDMVVYVCVVNEENECMSDDYKYQIMLQKTNNTVVNKNGYLESLTIGSDKIIENGEAVGNYSVNCDDEVEDDVFWCKVEYTAKAGTREVKVKVTPKSEYEIYDAISDPVVLSEGTNSDYFTLIKAGDSSKIVVCLYELSITVPESSGGASKPPVNNNNSHNTEYSPPTGDMSSFIIFMIMLVSLVASLFIYKKKVSNN